MMLSKLIGVKTKIGGQMILDSCVAAPGEQASPVRRRMAATETAS